MSSSDKTFGFRNIILCVLISGSSYAPLFTRMMNEHADSGQYFGFRKKLSGLGIEIMTSPQLRFSINPARPQKNISESG